MVSPQEGLVVVRVISPQEDLLVVRVVNHQVVKSDSVQVLYRSIIYGYQHWKYFISTTNMLLALITKSSPIVHIWMQEFFTVSLYVFTVLIIHAKLFVTRLCCCILDYSDYSSILQLLSSVQQLCSW